MKNRRGGRHIAAMAFRLLRQRRRRPGRHYSLTTSTRHLSFRRSMRILFFPHHHRLLFFDLLPRLRAWNIRSSFALNCFFFFAKVVEFSSEAYMYVFILLLLAGHRSDGGNTNNNSIKSVLLIFLFVFASFVLFSFTCFRVWNLPWTFSRGTFTFTTIFKVDQIPFKGYMANNR